MNLALIPVEKLLNATTLVNAHLEVQDRYREAAMVLWRSPRTAEERYLASGNRCSWVPYVKEFWMHYGKERARIPRIPAQPKEIDRMEELLDWHAWLATQDEIEAKIVFKRFGEHWRTKDIARRFGIHRNTVRKMAKSGIQKIVDQFLTQRRIAA